MSEDKTDAEFCEECEVLYAKQEGTLWISITETRDKWREAVERLKRANERNHKQWQLNDDQNVFNAELTAQIAELKTLIRAIWLHNPTSEQIDRIEELLKE